MMEQKASLADVLAGNLPEGLPFTHYHISTPPAPCTALYSPLPNITPEKTYCESHSLLVTISPVSSSNTPSEVAIFAIELQIYTTVRLTTVFISKADSTGFLSLLALPRHSGSALRSVTSAFVSWVIGHRHRPDRRLVLTLFARAQNQYLFPGSVENGKKHVLDDRALVKWWCKTLDPVLRGYAPESEDSHQLSDQTDERPNIRTKAYLIVPGHDAYETQSFFPPSFRADPPTQRRWINSHPLRQFAASPSAPPRCLVPHFPDDPKSRFLIDLDEELADAPHSSQSGSSKLESPSKRGKGQWKSVKTLEQFWELMAYRQECSSGRLVGFIWIVFTPDSLSNLGGDATRERSSSPSPSSRKRKLPSSNDETTAAASNSKRQKRRRFLASRERKGKKKLTGPIHPRPPRVKSAEGSRFGTAAATTKYYHSPPETRGTLVLSQKAYDRVHELLLRLDFSNLDVSIASTKRWITEAGVTAGVLNTSGTWGQPIVGKRPAQPKTTPTQDNGPTILTAKRKRSSVESVTANGNAIAQDELTMAPPPSATAYAPSDTANLLGASLVRKKPKPETAASAPTTQEQSQGRDINTLGAGLVRKKAKT